MSGADTMCTVTALLETGSLPATDVPEYSTITVDVAFGGQFVPSIRGRAWITGYVQHVLLADDPFPTGLTVGDIWSPIDD